MSRGLQLSSVSASYSLDAPAERGSGGLASEPTDSALGALTASGRITAGGAAAAVAAAAAAAAAAEEDAELDAAAYDDDAAGAGGVSDAAYGPVSTEVDPYALAHSGGGAQLYPSGLLGHSSVHGAESSHAESDRQLDDPFAPEADEQSAYDRRYADAEMPQGWGGIGGGSFRELDDADEEQFAAEQRRRADAEESEQTAGRSALYESGEETPGRQHDAASGRRKRNRGGDAEYDDDNDGQRSAEQSRAYGDARDEYDEGARENDDDDGHDRRKRHRHYADKDEDGSDRDAEDQNDAYGDDDRHSGSDSGSDSGSASGSSGEREDGDGERRRSRRKRTDEAAAAPSYPPAAGDDAAMDDPYHSVAAAAAASAASFLPPAAHPSHFANANYSPATPLHQRQRHSGGALGVSQYGAPTTPTTNHGGGGGSGAPHAYPMTSPSASSPHYSYGQSSYSPSPHFGPTSPRVHSGWGGGGYGSSASFGALSGASSPRQDTISSVTHRVEQLARSGRLASMLQAASRCAQEVNDGASGASALPTPDYAHLSSSTNSQLAARASSRAALISIDQHLLRRYMLNVLDSDMLVRGVVVNKSASQGLTINIAEILWPSDKAAEVLARQQSAAQTLVSHLLAAQKGGEGTQAAAAELCKMYLASQQFFPPLSSFLGNIHVPTSTPAANSLSNSGGGYASSLSSSGGSAEADPYAVERALFANFEVLAIHGECHLAEMQAPPAAAAVAGLAPSLVAAASASSASASLERFSLGEHVKALVISVDVHSEKVYLSMNQNRLRGNVASMHRLGVMQQPTPLAASVSADTVSASSAAAPGSFNAMLSKLKPDIQEKILAYGTAGGAASAVPPASPAAPPKPSAVSLAFGLASQPSPWHAKGVASAAGSGTPGANSALSAAHLQKARNALLGPGNSSKPFVPPSLSLLGNPQLLARARNYLSWLHEQPLFKNPDGYSKLLQGYKANPNGSLLRRQAVLPSDTYKSLRHAQNQAWAKESVVKGISLAKKGSFANALKCYKHALDIEPQFTQAFVARGAAYVLQGQLHKAIAEFEHALAIDPQQQYALAYLQAAREKVSGKPTTPVEQEATRHGRPSSSGGSARHASASSTPQHSATAASRPTEHIAARTAVHPPQQYSQSAVRGRAGAPEVVSLLSSSSSSSDSEEDRSSSRKRDRKHKKRSSSDSRKKRSRSSSERKSSKKRSHKHRRKDESTAASSSSSSRKSSRRHGEGRTPPRMLAVGADESTPPRWQRSGEMRYDDTERGDDDAQHRRSGEYEYSRSRSRSATPNDEEREREHADDAGAGSAAAASTLSDRWVAPSYPSPPMLSRHDATPSPGLADVPHELYASDRDAGLYSDAEHSLSSAHMLPNTPPDSQAAPLASPALMPSAPSTATLSSLALLSPEGASSSSATGSFEQAFEPHHSE